MAEALNSIYKAELVRNLGPWNGIDDLEIAPPNTSTGTTPNGSTENSITSHPSNTRPTTTPKPQPLS
jgi:putative transposase